MLEIQTEMAMSKARRRVLEQFDGLAVLGNCERHEVKYLQKQPISTSEITRQVPKDSFPGHFDNLYRSSPALRLS